MSIVINTGDVGQVVTLLSNINNTIEDANYNKIDKFAFVRFIMFWLRFQHTLAAHSPSPYRRLSQLAGAE